VKITTTDVVVRGDEHGLVTRQVAAGRGEDGVGQIVGIDVRPAVRAGQAAVGEQRPEVASVAGRVLHPRRTQRDDLQIGAPDGRGADVLAQDLAQPVRILRLAGVVLVDRQIPRPDRALGELEAHHGLAGDVDQAAHAPADARLDHVEDAHEVVVEHDMCGVPARGGQGPGVDHGVEAPSRRAFAVGEPADEREHVTGVGQVGCDIRDLIRRCGVLGGSVERGGQNVRGHGIVTGADQRVDGGPADLAAGPSDQDSHRVLQGSLADPGTQA
jgi:hypothetical protein